MAFAPLVRHAKTDTELYQANFHDGHGIGYADAVLGKINHSATATDPRRPGFGEGYRAGHRVGSMERMR